MSDKRAIFLDRDGVINPYHYNADFGTVSFPSTPEQFELFPGVAESIAEFNRRGFAVIVVSNQPGIAKGKMSSRILQAITVKMVKQLADAGASLDDVLYCTHDPEASQPEYRVHCDCRKPKPGMLFRAARERNLQLDGSFMVGDGVDDVLAGRAAGLTTILVGSRRCSICEEFAMRGAKPDFVATNLKQATEIIAALTSGRKEYCSIARAAHPCVPANGEMMFPCDPLSATAECDGLNAAQIGRLAELARSMRGFTTKNSTDELSELLTAGLDIRAKSR